VVEERPQAVVEERPQAVVEERPQAGAGTAKPRARGG